MASEVGALPHDHANDAKKWRVQPGKIYLVDIFFFKQKTAYEIKRNLVDKRPWKKWLEENLIDLESLPAPQNVQQPDHDTLRVRQHTFGYTVEDLKMVVSPMAVTGQEAIGSMGTDTPLACLSE